ncbi:protein-(glutamine-N5) methyltransferase, release factor-specific [Actinopolyspora erythraea]|uniref:Release factor glutamine methyltransferase n=1 Tax=Actinopolyspora erythraea TaxID=414996 RepID=A0A099D1I3_9ACTN|nr:peptide chain release factor N(5)-glutamine methyltransferase [Actinopolyspora erythraea]ASU77793.1 protein-(glutamine-N5) methyltransferase, release factor-specific [Actinopolyspora erythraea]KGI80008.1 modification methylase HemK [Actinopolyspora erythraea]
MDRKPLRLAILEGERVLAAAGIPSPRVDVESLAAHLLGVERTRLVTVSRVDQSVLDSLHELVRRRAERVPLQHLTGTAVLGSTTLSVGPGVFVPRPETEQLLEWALTRVREVPDPLVVDLCSGSGVLALAVAQRRPDARVLAVDNDPAALEWARHNVGSRRGARSAPVEVSAGDVTDPSLLSGFDGLVDLLVCNPPYVPEGTPVPPEVWEYDPPAAVFAGRDGLELMPHVLRCATRLLRSEGVVAIEHDDTHGEALPALMRGFGELTEVRDHSDLAGRPRFATAGRARRDD